MIIQFCPQLRGDTLSLSRAGDRLIVNGDTIDLSATPDGAELPADAISNDWLVGTVRRIADVLHLTLILPHDADAPASASSLRQGVANRLGTVAQALKIRNIWICVVMGILLVAYLVITWTFMPLFLTKVRGFSQTDASWLMATLGISATICSVAIPGLSDIIGRRPVMISMPLISLLLPLGALYYHGPYIGMVVIFFFGWALVGAFTAFMATVPSESVPPAMMATVFGLCMGVCEIVGGAGGPLIAGIVADRVGLQGPMWMLAGLTLAGGLFAFRITETPPRVLARRATHAASTAGERAG